MPNVFANAQVAHIWAQQRQPEGRSHNGNLSFRDSMIFSYATPIARMFRAKGLKVALMTVDGYSNSTKKQLGAVWSAVDYGRGDYRAFRVPFIGAHGGYRQRESDTPDHAANLAYLVEMYTATVEAQAKNRGKHRPEGEDLVGSLTRLANNVSEYTFLFDVDPAAALALNAESILASVAAIEKAREEYDTPEGKAKRAAARKRAAEKRAVEKAERVAKWRAGEGNALPSDIALDAKGGALIRINRNNMLETSLGAVVPLEHAIKAFRFLKLVRTRGVPWDRNGKVIRVGHFTVDRIEANGSFKAGCHTFNWPEIEHAARLANVVDSAADDSALEASR